VQTLGISDLPQVFTIFSTVILRIEANSAIYSEVFPELANALLELEQIPTNRYRKFVTNYLLRRFTLTAAFSHVVATYMLSPHGRGHIQMAARFSLYVQYIEELARQRILSLYAIIRIAPVCVIDLFTYYL
jgi:hypothetical protein